MSIKNSMEPKNFFPIPFAQNGAKNLLQETGDDTTGLANLYSGFPSVTEIPIKRGGIAPKRKDFNGAFFMLSAFAFFAQSGGIFTYNESLKYDSPALINYEGKLWMCMKTNGVGTAAGTRIPGSDEGKYWQNLAEYMHSIMIEEGVKFDNDSIGDIKMHLGIKAPEGWLICDGSPINRIKYPLLHAHLKAMGFDGVLPDWRGTTPRGYDPTGFRDPDGTSRKVGSIQLDAGKNITGWFGAWHSSGIGCFSYHENSAPLGEGIKGGGWSSSGVYMDASRSWGAAHTSNEFRMKNFSILYLIKHD